MRVSLLVVFAVIVAHVAPVGSAEELPRWEIGAGPAGITLPGYRGSDEQRGLLLPLPYFIYRGKKIDVDREGIHGLLKTDRLRLGFSLAGAPGVESDDNDARTGMPDLDPVFEVGPTLEIILWRDKERDERFSLALPFRGAIATDLSGSDGIGWVFAPQLRYDIGRRTLRRGWNLSVGFGPMYAAEEYHDYYYEVAPAFALPGRPAFDADGGYSGIRWTLTFARRFPKFWMGAFARYDSLSGAAFEDSPLIEQDDAVMAGVGIAWIITRSKHTAPARR